MFKARLAVDGCQLSAGERHETRTRQIRCEISQPKILRYAGVAALLILLVLTVNGQLPTVNLSGQAALRRRVDTQAHFPQVHRMPVQWLQTVKSTEP
jgi:hypothetical protein